MFIYNKKDSIMDLIQKNILDLKGELKSDLNMIPVFIDESNGSTECHNIFKETNKFLSKLISEKIISDSNIKYLVSQVNDIFNEMVEYNKDIGFLYYSYMIEILEYFLNKSEEYELYEASANFKRFIEKIKGF